MSNTFKVFDAAKFVEVLRTEGDTVRCDDSDVFFRRMELPAFYDEIKFKRGQKCFHDHIFAMFFGKLLGLVTSFAFPEARAILGSTGKSSKPEVAFKRYVRTILHMCTWYSNDMKPDSALLSSLTKVRNQHNLASKTCNRKNIGQITQYKMAVGQFGFMGYILARPKEIGLHNVAYKDLEGFVHFWRVIGHILGIQERYNICTDSVEETKAICDEIIKQVVKPAVLRWDAEFLSMAGTLTDGLWCMMPVLKRNVCLQYIYEMVTSEGDETTDTKSPELNYLEKFTYYFVYIMMYLLKFDVIRVVQKYNLYLTLYLTENLPFLAYYKFRKFNVGYKRYSEKKISNFVS